MDANLFKRTYMNVMKILTTGKPVFVKIKEDEELVIKKNLLNSQKFKIKWYIKGVLKNIKEMNYVDLYEQLLPLDPFNFSTKSYEKTNVIKIDFVEKKVI